MTRKDIKTVSTTGIGIEHGGQGGQVPPPPKLNQKQKFGQSPDYLASKWQLPFPLILEG